ncbi:MAG TPA: diaminobutyrate acetyltransferase [Pseudonocardiaceae bacterium]|jgi:diaminobutyrate acetyltransferase|nr:diaminobutyrate acetyltransferase [Pseudonocardiaceae bacterium]
MAAADESHRRLGSDAGATGISICPPDVSQGGRLWQLARDSAVLDVNSSYAYLLWCHDFAATSAVALAGEGVVGFVTGYLRPDAPDALMVWQVAVDSNQRGRGLASRMLHHLLDRLSPRGVRWLHTTISPDNAASIRLFSGVARDRGTGIERRDLFAAHHFPAEEATGSEHQAEDLYVIGPLSGQPEPDDQTTSTSYLPRTEQQ